MIKFNLRSFRKKIDTFPVPNEFEIIEKERLLEGAVPIHLKDDMDKVRKAPFGISLEQEFKEFHATNYKSGPFYHYQIDNLFLIKNRIYFDNYEYRLNPREKAVRIFDSKDIDLFENAAFSSMRISTVFFGHWLREELMLIDYLQGKNNIVSSSPSTHQKREITDLFNLKCHLTSYSYIKTADMYEGWQHSNIYFDILRKYKDKISSFSEIHKASRQRIVYLQRGNSATNRVLENENKMLELLSIDFDVLSFVAESTPIKELYAAIYSADIILSIEGSQMAHAIIAGKPGSTLLCIQPPYRFYNPFKKYCSDAGIRYAVFVADKGVTEESFNVNFERFKKLLELIESDR